MLFGKLFVGMLFGLVLISLTPSYSEPVEAPEWIGKIFSFWMEEKISNEEFFYAFEYLTNKNILTISSLGEMSSYDTGYSHNNFDSSLVLRNYSVFVHPVPTEFSYMTYSVNDAVEFWTKQTLNKFHFVDDPKNANIIIRWVTTHQGPNDAYVVDNRIIEVGMGKTACQGKWKPFSENDVTSLLKHEFGHILGFDHSSNPHDIMYPYIYSSHITNCD